MINNKTVLAVIPARGGSKGIPGKNIKLLNGKPLIYYTIDEAKKSRILDKIIVSSDDSDILNICSNYLQLTSYKRPKELAGDSANTVDAVIHLLDWLKNEDGYTPYYTCVLQCTSPLRTWEDIDGCIELLEETQLDGVVAISEVDTHPYWTHIMRDGKLDYFIEEGRRISLRQDLPQIYRINGAVYVVKTNILLKQRTLEPMNMTGYIMKRENSIDIDDKIDFALAEILLKDRECNA